jgi:hypothetical protein
MSGIDFSQYPIVNELIHECELDQDRDHILWLRETQSDAAILLAEMHLMCKAGLTNNIPLRNRSKVAANYYYSNANSKVHAFASNQALSDLKMTEKDLAKLFSHKDVFGRG